MKRYSNLKLVVSHTPQEMLRVRQDEVTKAWQDVCAAPLWLEGWNRWLAALQRAEDERKRTKEGVRY